MKYATLSLVGLLWSTTLCTAQPLHHGSAGYSSELYASEPVEGNFNRMFPLDFFDLQAHPSPRYDLVRFGGREGPMNEANSGTDVGDSAIEAGITFLGQFIDHDITLDLTSTLNARAVPEDTRNFRTPDLDLDCVYGDGPEGSPWLYKPNTPYLIVGEMRDQGRRNDLARVTGTNVALIGDPRNDENFIVSQIHAAFIAFHNKLAREHLVQLVAETGAASFEELEGAQKQAVKTEAFEAAREDVIHYYHRMIAEYFLPKVIGVTRTIDIATNGRRFYLPDLSMSKATPEMPVEFSAAAFRYGHSQVREGYQIRVGDPELATFSEMRKGFSPVTDESVIDFALFFPIARRSGVAPQKTRKLDPRLPDVLFDLETAGITPPGAEGALAARNLLRGRSFRLPAGEDLFRIVAGANANDLPEDNTSDTRHSALPELLSLNEGDKSAEPVQVASLRVAQQSSLWEGEKLGDKTIRKEAADIASFVVAPDEVKANLVVESSPLWYYVLHEAAQWEVKMVPTPGTNHVWPTEVAVQDSMLYLAALRDGEQEVQSGQILGPVGGTIVGEVLLGLIDHYREKTNRGLDHIPAFKPNDLNFTDFAGFGERMTFGDMIQYIGWDQAPVTR